MNELEKRQEKAKKLEEEFEKIFKENIGPNKPVDDRGIYKVLKAHEELILAKASTICPVYGGYMLDAYLQANDDEQT